MTKSELIAQFLLAAANAATEEAIGEAVKTLPSDGVSQIADTVASICRAKGLDPQHSAIQAVYKETAEYKAAREAENRRADLSRAVTNIEAITKTYRENEERGAVPTPEQVEAETGRLTKAIAGLGAVGTQRRMYTPADYLAECLTYDPGKDFSPALFGGLAFPDGTTSYIGARTSRGKTTAMVNLAREAITGHKNKRKCVFITLEMSGKQIFNKLILATALASSIQADDGETGAEYTALLSVPNPGKEIYHVWKGEGITGEDRKGPEAFRKYVSAAYQIIETAQKEGQFFLYDGRSATEAEIINFMRSQGDAGTIILLDYIQKMPPKDGADTDSFRRVQAISYDVVNTAAATNAVIIAGAQFNRLGGTDGLGDVFTDESFRECGDLEQDAHNAIGIGWKVDKQNRFYEVLKTREDCQQGDVFDIFFDGSYSFMTQGKKTKRKTACKKKDEEDDPSVFHGGYRGRTIMD
jgi:hypothetical protein